MSEAQDPSGVPVPPAPDTPALSGTNPSEDPLGLGELAPVTVSVGDIQALAAPEKAQPKAIVVTLDQIINQGVQLPTNTPAETPVVIKSLNLRGYTMLIKKFKGLTEIPDLGVDPEALKSVLAILVNQDRPVDKQQNEDELAARIDLSKLPIVDKIIGEQIRPFLSRLAVELKKAREAEKNRGTKNQTGAN